MLGYCYHTFESPVVRVAAVTDARTGAPIRRVVLSDIAINGTRVTDVSRLNRPPVSFGLTSRDSALACEVSCGFGVEEGRYQLVVRAPGYESRALTLAARYARVRGGCPSSSAGSTDVKVTLVPLRRTNAR